MSRGIWFLAGASAGVYAAVRGRRVAEMFTPDGLADRVGGLAAGLRVAREEVASGRAARESELRERLAPALDGGPAGGPPPLHEPAHELSATHHEAHHEEGTP